MDVLDGKTTAQPSSYLRSCASELREYTVELDRAILSLVWQGTAASLCRSDLNSLRTNLSGLADELDDAADQLVTHLASAERRRHTLDRLAHEAVHEATQETAHLAGRAANVLSAGNPLGALSWSLLR